MDFLIKYIKEVLDWLLGLVGWILIETFKLVCIGLAAIPQCRQGSAGQVLSCEAFEDVPNQRRKIRR